MRASGQTEPPTRDGIETVSLLLWSPVRSRTQNAVSDEKATPGREMRVAGGVRARQRRQFARLRRTTTFELLLPVRRLRRIAGRQTPTPHAGM